MTSPQTPRQTPTSPVLVPLSNIAPRRLHWLSPGRLAAGKITILDGDPGLGKSTLLCDWAARISRGQPLPGGRPGPSRKVILMSAEDDLYDTIRPRLAAARGDPRQVIALGAVPTGNQTATPIIIPDHADLLAETIQRTNPALLIVDPLHAFLPRRASANSEQAIRYALASLRAIAERSGAAIVVVRNLTGVARNTSLSSIPRFRDGASGTMGAARCGLLIAPDPDDPQRRILAATNDNLGHMPPSLVFHIESMPGNDVARVVWDGESDWSANQLLRFAAGAPTPHSVLTKARAWLREMLEEGPLSATVLHEEASFAGFSRDIMYAARKAEGIHIRKERVADGRWMWSRDDVEPDYPFHPDAAEVPEVQEVPEVPEVRLGASVAELPRIDIETY